MLNVVSQRADGYILSPAGKDGAGSVDIDADSIIVPSDARVGTIVPTDVFTINQIDPAGVTVVAEAGVVINGQVGFSMSASSPSQKVVLIKIAPNTWTCKLLPITRHLNAVFSQSVASGTNGGVLTAGVWTPRPLNYVEANEIPGCSLNTTTGVVTLPPGRYLISADASAALCGLHVLALRNVRTGATYVRSSNRYINNTGSYSADSAFINTTLSLAASTDVQLQHYCSITTASNGMGYAASIVGTLERYASIDINSVALY